MRIAYCSLLLPEEKKIAERSRGHLSGVSLHKFTKAMISGLDANLSTPVKVFNIINTLNYPKFPEIIFRNEDWSHTDLSDDKHIGYINLFGIKYITQAHCLYNELNKWAKSIGNERFILCVHHNYYPMMKAALKIKHKYRHRVITCLISGDIPGKFGLKSQYKDSIKEKLIERMNESLLRMAKNFDSFVFQTPYMGEGFGVQNKPICVMECTYLPTVYSLSNKATTYNPDNKKVIFYAGSLREEYDALHLLESFKYIDGNDYEFWLAGGGNAVERIKARAKKDPRIKYLGFISPQEVYDRQQASTVLVSPRKSNHTFVKYSFPSKTMECLASGVPYVAHQLPCEPEEYRNYILYPNSESDLDLAKMMIKVCNMTEEERRKIGERNRLFIIEQKNPAVMCSRIIDFWKALLESK